MSEIWPANLVEELAYRRCVIFIGSGVSATAKNGEGQSPETWSVFYRTTLIISKKPGNTGISRDIRTEFTTDLLLSD